VKNVFVKTKAHQVLTGWNKVSTFVPTKCVNDSQNSWCI